MVKLMLNLVILSLLLSSALALNQTLMEIRKSICLEPSSYGSCKERQLRFHYDALSNSCNAFYYSGCGGTQNRFESQTQCWDYCMDPEITYEI
ncbi:kunitz-type serine protease inhibitor HCRG2-like [Drosophila subobscura]|uniref:kunitz-type serine protease inhibitor HCRG2-like n=1 Tax=Drosophila subobscura TaxID=7241 RepID=UPI00155A546B|nr:kunitz-type serine protease inhibitor HCRG2-like [Drosophila subobscura]